MRGRLSTALLLVDLLQDWRGPDGRALHTQVTAIVPAVLGLRRAADVAHVPVIYVNDQALGARRLVIAGCATDVCVLATAQDAVLRKLRVVVPTDVAAAVTPAQHASALALMARTMDADVAASAERRVFGHPMSTRRRWVVP